jgi:hypothetical protein
MAMLAPRARCVNDAGINPFCILDILSRNRFYFAAAARHSYLPSFDRGRNDQQRAIKKPGLFETGLFWARGRLL